MRKKVKIFGERNTGTNYITDMILKNFSVKVLSDGPPYSWEKRFGLSETSMSNYFLLTKWRNLGWKHAKIEVENLSVHECFFVVVIKNPYSWLLSLHKRPYHNPAASDLSFSEFIRTPWPTMKCDGLDAKLVMPVELWNKKNRSYYEFCKQVKSSLLISYEGVLDSPVDFLSSLSTILGEDIRGEVKLQNTGSKSSDKHRTFSNYRDYYLNEMWREKITKEDVVYVNSELDEQLVNNLGYSLI